MGKLRKHTAPPLLLAVVGTLVLLFGTGADDDVECPTRSGRKDRESPHGEGAKCGTIDAEKQIHIVYATDETGLRGMVASSVSALRSAQQPERLYFHILVPSSFSSPVLVCDSFRGFVENMPREFCNAAIEEGRGLESCEEEDGSEYCSCDFAHDRFRVATLGDAIATEIEVASTLCINTHKMLEYLEKSAMSNFARNWLHEILLPRGVEKCIYLDIDTLVVRDIALLWDSDVLRGGIMAATENCSVRLDHMFDFKNKIVRKAIPLSNGCHINAGVLVLDLLRYAEHDIKESIIELINSHVNGRRIWKFGIHQPSFILALYNHTTIIDSRWNLGGLGHLETLSRQEISEGYILHWNGANPGRTMDYIKTFGIVIRASELYFSLHDCNVHKIWTCIYVLVVV